MGKKLENEFSWSKSRHERFKECRRAYYFQYYAAWGGWESTAPRFTRELYTLKKLSNRFTWAGSVVHDSVRFALQATQHGRTVDGARQIERAHAAMQDDFAFSRRKGYWNEPGRKPFFGLLEHEYDEAVPNDAWKANWESAKAALEWFYGSRWLELARELTATQWLEVDTTNFDSSHFQLEGVRVFAIPDFAYREADGTAVIVDWKTGKAREGYDDQLVAYALYLSVRYGLPIERMRAVLVYLNDGKEVEVSVAPEAVEAFKARFRQSVEGMRALLFDQAKNVPLPEGTFELATDLMTCARCPFRRPCGREQAARDAVAAAATSSAG